MNDTNVANFTFLGEVAIHALAWAETERRLTNLRREANNSPAVYQHTKSHQARVTQLGEQQLEITQDVNTLVVCTDPDLLNEDLGGMIAAAIGGERFSVVLAKAYHDARAWKEEADHG